MKKEMFVFLPHIHDVNSRVGTHWRDVDTDTQAREIPPTPSMLRFTPSWLRASQFQFEIIESETLITQHFSVIRITGGISGKQGRGGLVFDIEAEELDHAKTMFIALGRWRWASLLTGYKSTRPPKPSVYYDGRPYPFQICIVAR
jgi:hypothetical protein